MSLDIRRLVLTVTLSGSQNSELNLKNYQRVRYRKENSPKKSSFLGEPVWKFLLEIPFRKQAMTVAAHLATSGKSHQAHRPDACDIQTC